MVLATPPQYRAGLPPGRCREYGPAMSFRITLALGFAIGYVLGSKAGRQRYEQIMRTARKIRENPSVQGAAGVLQAQADSAVSAVRQKLHADGGTTAVSNGHRH